MYIYITVTFVLCWIFYPIIIRRYGKKHANLFILCVLLPVCVFAMGLRTVHVGVDTLGYSQRFNNYIHHDWIKVFTDDDSEDRLEIGFRILMKFCADIYPSYYFYQLIFSFIYVSLGFYFIYKTTSNILLTASIFLGGGLYMQAFNIARQMFAVIIGAYALMFLLRGNFIKYLLVIALAYCFHSTSLILLTMGMLYPFKNNKIIFAVIPIVLLTTVFFVDQIILPIVYTIFDEKYIWYILNDYDRPNSGIVTKTMWIINFLLSVIAYYFQSNAKFVAFFSLIAVACFWIGLSINYVDRLGLYFLPCIIILYDRIAENVRNKHIKLIYIHGFTLFYITYFCYWTYTNEAVAYNSIIN